MLGTQRCRLQPHHAAEVALEGVGTGVVPSGTEQTVRELNFLIVHQQSAEIVFCFHTLVNLLLLSTVVIGILHGLPRKQVQCHVEELAVAPGNASLLTVVG